MGAAQIIMIVILSLDFAFNLAKHGEAKPDYNAFASAIALIIYVLILRWGGFWSH